MLYQARERAKLTVGGREFEDWTSIFVQRTWGDPYDQFKFTCAERDGATASEVQSSGQFKPGDSCRIELAGQLAITGLIVTRQASYEANSHGIQLQGTNRTWAAATSGIEHQTNSFDGKTFDEIAKEVLDRAGARYTWKGKPPQTTYDYCHTEQGETIFDFLQRIARNVNVVVGCDKDGKFLFVGENPDTSNQGQLIEGTNILKLQCIISSQQKFSKYIIRTQSNASNGSTNSVMYRKASEKFKEKDGPAKDLYYRVKVVPMEQPTTKTDTVEKRAETELMWDAGTEVNATIVVYGWQPDGSGDLWEPGADVTVKSPMAMLDQVMRIQSVTYTQDNNGGSLTTLVCVNPWALKSPKYLTRS